MAVYRKNGRAYGISSPTVGVPQESIISSRIPTSNDRAEISTIWVYQDGTGAGDDIYILSSVIANTAYWISLGGGTGTFESLVISGTSTLTGAVSMASTLTVSTFAANGVVLNSAAGLLSTAPGTSGQILCGSTGAVPAWTNLTSASLVITEGAGTLNLEESGGTANSFVTTAGGPIAPLAGVTDVLGYDANITTDGNTANTIKIRLADAVTTVGALTAGANLGMSTGVCTIESNSNAGDAIYLHADGGVNEQIHIHADQGTGINSITIESDVGGLVIASDMASADAININASNVAGGIDVDYGTGGMTVDGANGAFTLQTGTGNILLGADATDHDMEIGDAAGSNAMSLISGTGHTTATSTGDILLTSQGDFKANSGSADVYIADNAVAQNVSIATGAAAKITTISNATGASQVIVDCGTAGASFGASATAHTTLIGSTNTTSTLTLQSGTSAFTSTAGGAYDVNAAGPVTVDSSAGEIRVGADNVDQPITIGAAGARVMAIGNATGITELSLIVGTGNLDLGVNATAHATRLGSATGVSETTLNSGTGNFTINAGDEIVVGAAGGVTETIVGAIATTCASSSIITSADSAQAVYLHTNGGTSETIKLENTQGTDAAAIALTSTAGGVTIIADATTGIVLSAAGSTSIVGDTGTAAAAAITLNKRVGVATLTGITTATTASQAYTITNSVCQATSGLIITVANKSAGNDCKIQMDACTPGAGSFTIDTTNVGTQALDSDVIITWMIIN